jgi:hypothetical protein
MMMMDQNHRSCSRDYYNFLLFDDENRQAVDVDVDVVDSSPPCYYCFQEEEVDQRD